MEICNRNTNNIKIAVECQFMQGKICDMSTLLKYAKNAVIGKILAIAYLHKTDMPNILGFIKIRLAVLKPREGGSKFALDHYFGYWLLQQLVLLYKP